MDDKVFKTHDELIDLLISRGLKVPDRERGIGIIKDEGYYNLVNGYKKPFLISTFPEIYHENSTIDEIFALYKFDKALREIFLSATLHIETKIKTAVAYEFSRKYGHDNYLKYINCDTGQKNANENILKLISSIQKQIASHSNDPNILHYLSKYGYIPLWVLNSILTFGAVSKFYSLMPQNLRQNISKDYNIQDKTLINFLFYITAIRNFSAHGNRLYCFKSRKPLASTKVHSNLKIDNAKSHLKCKTDLFAAIIVLRYLLSNNEFKYFFDKLTHQIDKLDKSLHSININDILNIMGFPENWKSINQPKIKQ